MQYNQCHYLIINFTYQINKQHLNMANIIKRPWTGCSRKKHHITLQACVTVTSYSPKCSEIN